MKFNKLEFGKKALKEYEREQLDEGAKSFEQEIESTPEDMQKNTGFFKSKIHSIFEDDSGSSNEIDGFSSKNEDKF